MRENVGLQMKIYSCTKNRFSTVPTTDQSPISPIILNLHQTSNVIYDLLDWSVVTFEYTELARVDIK